MWMYGATIVYLRTIIKYQFLRANRTENSCRHGKLCFHLGAFRRETNSILATELQI